MDKRTAARFLLIVVSLLWAAGSRAQQTGQRRPLIVVFAADYLPPAEPAPQLKETGPRAPAPAVTAMRAVRDRLAQSNLVEVLAYQPDTPTFLRAIRENRLSVNAENPVAGDRVALGKAVGALYILTVSLETEKEAGTRIDGEAVEVATRKAWRDNGRARVERKRVLAAPATTATTPLDDEIRSAANTLVQKFLNGPLGDLARAAAATPILPPPPASGETPGDPVTRRDVEAESQAAQGRGEKLLADGDAAGAIVALRQAVNLAPRAGAPRAALVRAYLAAGRGQDAVAETRRALDLVRDDDGKIELTRLLAQALSRSGDTTAAAATYAQIIEARPRTTWARIALADLLLAQDRAADAEAQLRAVRKIEPGNAEAAARLARLRAALNDYAGAATELTGMEPEARRALLRDLFDGGALALAAEMARARTAFDEGKITREALQAAVGAKSVRAADLLALIRGAAPPENSGSELLAHRRRVLAATLLAQSLSSALAFIETGEAASGGRADLLLSEARREIAEAQAAERTTSPGPSSATGRGSGPGAAAGRTAPAERVAP